MPRLAIPVVIAPVFMVACAARPIKPVGTPGTLAELRIMRPDLQEVKVEQGLDQAMQQYRRFLEEAPETAMTPEAMRRLADLQLEKQFGIRPGHAKPRESALPGLRRSAVQARRVLLHAQTLPRRRERLFGHRRTGNRLRVLRARAL